MPFVGPNYFSTAINGTFIAGGINWSNPSNITNAPDGSYAVSLVANSEDLDIYNWQGVLPSNITITSLVIALFGHTSTGVTEALTIQAYNNAIGNSAVSLNISGLTDTWTSNLDITSLFGGTGNLATYPTLANFNAGHVGFLVYTDAPGLGISLDSARMTVGYALDDLSYMYSRKRRRFKNKKGKIIAMQSRIKG